MIYIPKGPRIQLIFLKDMDPLIYQDKMSKYRDDCGCALGGVFLIVSFVCYGGYVVSLHIYTFRSLFIGIAVVFASAISGKMIGIAIARVRLKMLQKHVLRLAQQH